MEAYQRDDLDFFVTPAYVVEAILPHLALGGLVLDPCAGEGNILDVVSDIIGVSNVIAYEIDPTRAAVCDSKGYTAINRIDEGVAAFEKTVCRDALSSKPWHSVDLVIMNPPYRRAQEFVERACDEMSSTNGTVAALLPLTWVESIKRYEFHRVCPGDFYFMAQRPSFTGDNKTDSVGYMWAIYGPGRGGRWYPLTLEKSKSKLTRLPFGF